MGISSVAEGVETEDQLAGLRTLGCQVGQGFYLSHPLRAEEFDELRTRQCMGSEPPVTATASTSTSWPA